MKICLFIFLLPAVSGILSNFFNLKRRCESPFLKSANDSNLRRILKGFFKCPYEPSANPNLKIEDFVQIFYIQSGQNYFSVNSISDITELINPNYPNFILIHGFNDEVQFGGMYFCSIFRFSFQQTNFLRMNTVEEKNDFQTFDFHLI